MVIGTFLAISSACSIAQEKQPERQPVQTQEKATADLPREITGKDGAPMVLVPAGEFQMGTDPAEIPELVRRGKTYLLNAKASWFEDETPRHAVYLDAFYIDKYEVTNAQYRRFVQATGYREPEGWGYVGGKLFVNFKPWSDENYNSDNQPVVCVSWEDAKVYCEWAGKRLPTEAEWEKAARGGLTGKQYVWGDAWPPPKGAGNFADETAKSTFTDWFIIEGYHDGYTYPAPVGSFDPNRYGLYDMAGNVWEWCEDWYDKSYYVDSPRRNPAGPSSGELRVSRGGGSGCYYAPTLRAADRGSARSVRTSSQVGFRCVAQDSSVTP